MSVLVTGGAGYIGSHVALCLLDQGERVVVLDDLSTGVARCIPSAATFIKGDVGDSCTVRQVLKVHAVDSIVHLAGSVVVPESVAKPLAYYHNNTANSRSLIETAIAAGVRHFIFSSTAAIYGQPSAEIIDETAPLAPISPYGWSKMMTEMMLRDAAHAHDFSYVALRYFNVAGADPRGRSGQSTPRATHLIKVACETALGKRAAMQLFGTDYATRDGTCIRDYIHVTDLADAHVAALRYLRAAGTSDVFNCGYGRGFSVLEVIEAVKRASGRSFEVQHAARRPGDPAALVATSEKIRKVLGWTPRLDSLDDMVRHALEWEASLS
jgi:UDP-glucose 4-epimerase